MDEFFFSMMIFGDLVMVTTVDIPLSQSYSSHLPQSDYLEQASIFFFFYLPHIRFSLLSKSGVKLILRRRKYDQVSDKFQRLLPD